MICLVNDDGAKSLSCEVMFVGECFFSPLWPSMVADLTTSWIMYFETMLNVIDQFKTLSVCY